MSEKHEDKTEQMRWKRRNQNRWFALGICFLMINAWAVLRNNDRPKVIDAVSQAPGSESEEAPESIQIVDDQGEVVLAGKEDIRWDFPVDMVESSETHVWKFSGPVDFSPIQPGMFCWISQRSLVFKPEDSWPIGKTVRTIRNDRLLSLDGQTFELRKTNYKTQSLKLEKTDFKGSGGLLEFRFNTPVRPEELLKHLNIQGLNSGALLSLKSNQTEPSQTIEVELDDDQYQYLDITLDHKLLPAEGDLGMEETRKWTLRSNRELQVRSVRGRMHSYGKGEIEISFSHSVQHTHLRGNVEIQPDLAFQVLPGRSYWRKQCRIQADFEPGTTYKLTFRKGIASTNGWPNSKLIERSVRMSDRRADASFLHAGSHLSPHGHLRVPINTVNVEDFDVSISRIFPNNLVIFGMRNASKYSGYYGYAHQGLSEPIVKQHSISVPHTPNETVESAIQLRELLEPPFTGIYHIDIKGKNTSKADRKILHITDIGVSLQHSADEILVWANSLSTLEPISDAKVTLFSENNQVLLSGTTNAEGLAQLAVPPHVDSKPILLTVEKANDVASLFLPETRIDSPVANVGRPYLQDRHEAFLFTGRGIYRPGETAHLKAIVRNAKAEFTKPFPVELRVHHPDGRNAGKFNTLLSENGTAHFAVPFEPSWPLGRYTFKLALSGSEDSASELGSLQVNLEEFTASKLEVAVNVPGLDSTQSSLKAGDPLEFEVSAHHLTGRPADGMPLKAFLRYRPVEFSHPDWEDFTFQDQEKAFPAEFLQLKNVGSGTLNEEGKYRFSTTVALLHPPSNAEMVLASNVRDVAGRAVAGSMPIPLHAYPLFVGLRQGEKPGTWEAAAVTPEGQAVSDGTELRFSVHQITHSLILRKDDNGHYRYQSDRHLNEVHEANASTQSGRAAFELPEDLASGNYLIRAEHLVGGSSATMKWEVQKDGTVSKTWSSEEPEKVELSFAQETYHPGDRATLRIAAPFSGKALVAFQQDSVLETKVLQLDAEGTGQLEFVVTADHFPNAWATVSVIRAVVPGDADWQTHRAFGAEPLRINPEPRQLTLAITAPEETLPAESFATQIQVTDAAGQPVQCEVALALVDEGILSLTRFQTPNPIDYFHDLRTPHFQLYDPYGQLLPDTDGDLIQNKLAVGAGGAALAKFLNPFQAERFKNLALWKPAVQTDAEGKAMVDWELPEFSGKVRLMAVAAEAGKFGSAQKNVVIKRPFTVVTGLPRFLAPGDQFQMPLRIFNDSEEELEVSWQMKVSDHLKFGGVDEQQVDDVATLGAGASFSRKFGLEVGSTPGVAYVEITAKSGDDTYHERIDLSIRPAYAREYNVLSGVLLEGEKKELPVAKGFLASTTAGQLDLSPTPDTLAGPLLESLISYPYGCLEQTTSRSMPLLFVQDLFRRLDNENEKRGEIEEYVQAGIQRILSMQNAQGTYGWWPGDREVFHWGTLYATQFLLEAKAAGFQVSDLALQRSIKKISDWLSLAVGSETDRQELQTYALQVLAMAEKVPQGWLQRFWELKDELSAESQIRLASAYLYSGDRRKANAMANAIQLPKWTNNKVRSWRTLRSPLRTQAIYLNLHVELDPGSATTARMVGELVKVLEGSTYLTTQENAMLLLAMGKYARHLGDNSQETKALLVVDGKALQNDAPTQTLSFEEGKVPGQVSIQNQGPGPLYYAFTVDGIPDAQPAPLASGVMINRLIDAEDFPIQRGDLVSIELVIDTRGSEIDHLAIQDLLPAGLEIESSKPYKLLRHHEHRDDRFLAFPKAINGLHRFEYMARAVTAGTFTLPAPTAVCMYDAEIQAIGEAATLTIVEN